MKKYILQSIKLMFIILFTVNSFCVLSQVKNKFAYKETDGNRYTRIPLIIENNKPFIEVKIDTVEVLLLVDIGGFGTINLDSSLVKRLHLNTGAGNIKSKDYKGKDINLNEFNISKLVIGDISFSNIKGYLGRDKNGYIGLSFFKNFSILLDYRNSFFYLIEDNNYPKKLDVSSWDRINFNFDKYGISTSIKIKGKEYTFFWDTGATYSLIKPDFVDINTIVKKGQYSFFHATDVTVGNKKTEPFDLLVMNFKFPPFDGVLGHNFFVNKMILIDFKNHTIAIK